MDHKYFYLQGLIHEQHLQHQGWQAAVANLDDMATELKKKKGSLTRVFDDYLETR